MVSLKRGIEDAYDWPCEVKLPNPRIPGQFTICTFKGRFRALPSSESRAMVAEADQARELGRVGEAMDLDKQLLRQVVAGWEGIEEPFSEDTLEEAMDNPFFLSALMTGYRKSISGEGVQRRREKN